MIGRHLEDEGPGLTDDAGLASCLTEIARVFDADASMVAAFERSTGSTPSPTRHRRSGECGRPPRCGSLARPRPAPDLVATRRGLGRRRGLLGVATCAAAATVAPAVLLAIPGWAGTAAWTRGTPLAGATSPRELDLGSAPVNRAPSARPSSRPPRRGALVDPGRRRIADRTHPRALAEGETPPTLEDADAARRWLALARDRTITAAGVDA